MMALCSCAVVWTVDVTIVDRYGSTVLLAYFILPSYEMLQPFLFFFHFCLCLSDNQSDRKWVRPTEREKKTVWGTSRWHFWNKTPKPSRFKTRTSLSLAPYTMWPLPAFLSRSYQRSIFIVWNLLCRTRMMQLVVQPSRLAIRRAECRALLSFFFHQKIKSWPRVRQPKSFATWFLRPSFSSIFHVVGPSFKSTRAKESFHSSLVGYSRLARKKTDGSSGDNEL